MIDAEIEPLTNEQRSMLSTNEEYVANYNNLQSIEIIKSIPNFDFNIPILGNGNISNGNITLSIPFINKGIMFNQSDLETFRQLLTK